MGSRTWIKVYCDKWLEGTISEESISVRGVWISLLALAGNGKYGDSGRVMALDGVGFNNNQLAAMLKISLNLWVATKKRLRQTGRVEVSPENIITIVNWNKYQSEYERTSKYRIKATTTDTANGTPREREERIEKVEVEDTTPSFIAYKEKLSITYPKLDIDEEWERCQIWYRDHNKLIKSPSLALGNWCKKEMEIQAEKTKAPGKNAGVNRINSDDPDKYVKGKFGHMVRR